MRLAIPSIVLAIAGLSLSAPVQAAVVPNNGGTADMPIHAPYTGETPMQIIDGLPAGTTIDIGAVMPAPATTAEVAGGVLGGTKSGGMGSPLFNWNMQGTGALAGFNRVISFPAIGPGVGSDPAYASANFEVHAAPRTPGNPVQSFDTQMFRMFSQILGDPDFDLLRVVGGNDFGLPSPGHTTLTQLPGGNWAVDSFFDITYRIDFVGAQGGALAGHSGSTTGTVRFSTTSEAHGVPVPGALSAGAVLLTLLGGYRLRRHLSAR